MPSRQFEKMIEVSVQFKGFLAHLSGSAEMCLTAEPGIQLSNFLVLLGERLGGDFRKLILDNSGTVDKSIMIVIEGKAIPPSHFMGYRLENSCSLSIIPVVAGG
jgi:sulfur carrier protein ThiS